MERLQTQERIEAAKIAAKMDSVKEGNRSKEEIAGFQAGFDIIRDLLDDDKTGK